MTQLPLTRQLLRKSKLLLLCCLVLMSGCTLRLVYHFLDWGMQWKLNHYLALTPEQKSFAKTAIDNFHNWHQQHELPGYVAYISYLQKRLPEGHLTADDIHAESDKIQLFMDASFTHLLPSITELLATLNDKQIQELDKTLTQDRKDYYKQYIKVTPQVLQEKLSGDFKSYLEPNIGKLTKEQNLWVQEWSKQLKPFGESIVRQQQIWATQLLATLQHRQDKSRLQNELRELLLYRTDNWDPATRDLVHFNEHLSLELIARILNNLSAKQQTTLDDNLAIYKQDCVKLVAELLP